MARSKLSPTEAEEYTRNLGQVTVGNFGLMEMAMHVLKVPQALGMENDEWVQERLGGYVRWTVEQRQEAVAELSGEPDEKGRYTRSDKQVAEILGISRNTVKRDREVLGIRTSKPQIEAAKPEKGTSKAQKRTIAEKRPEIWRLLDEGKSNAEIAVVVDCGVSTVSKERAAYNKEKAPGKSPRLRGMQERKRKREQQTPEHERKAAEAKLDEFRRDVVEKLSTMRSPSVYIESAIEEIRWFISEDFEVEDEDVVVQRYIELGREIQVYAARRDIDTTAIDEMIAAITKE
jgi:DNA-binding CsgD family transcriptional regulator